MNPTKEEPPQIPQENNNLSLSTLHDPPSTTKLKVPQNFQKFKSSQSIVIPEKDEGLVYEEIKDSKFKQQRLPAWRPVPTILSIIIVFSFFGIAFIILGIFILIYAYKIKKVEIDYTNLPNCKINENCTTNRTIEEDIDQPIFIYYQLDGFYQNARRYLKSKSIDQLTGEADATEDCEPAETNDEMGFNKSVLGNILKMKEKAIPCGLMAKSFFNDTFSFSINGDNSRYDDENIAFEKDKELFDKEIELSKQWRNITDEHFLVWMRPSGLPNPRKLWGRIKGDLKKGDNITINITNNYDVKHYEGKKKIILSNTTIFGGRNIFLGICYLVVGGLSLICAIIFPIGYKIQMSKEKDL